ncbi:MAG TPA: hypothetical protein VF212_13570 [Longimicrobiales bacterium]
MKLPNASAACVEYEKLTGYLLSDVHPVGRTKAQFFRGLGFDASRPEALLAALLRIARDEEVVEQEATAFGRKYVIDGALEGPTGASARMRTIWIVERGSAAPRFVTAYPAPGRKEEG